MDSRDGVDVLRDEAGHGNKQNCESPEPAQHGPTLYTNSPGNGFGDADGFVDVGIGRGKLLSLLKLPKTVLYIA